MPKFLENKLKAEYGENSKVPYKVMNSIGAMRGNEETAKGREMEAKHEAKMKKPMMDEMRIQIHRGPKPKMAVTGHTVHHSMMPKPTGKSGAFMEHEHTAFPFDANGESSSHGNMLDHIGEHLGLMGSAAGNAKGGSAGADAEAEDEE